MNTRRSLSILMIVTALFAGACGNNDKDSDSAKNKDKSSETKDSDKSTSSTISDEDFSAEVGKVNKAVDEAGDDLCKLVEALSVSPPEPTSSAQVKDVVGTYTKLLDSVAATLPEASAANADALRKAGDELSKAAEAASYPTDFFSGSGFTSVMQTEGVTAGLNEFQTMAAECQPTEAPDAPTGDSNAPSTEPPAKAEG